MVKLSWRLLFIGESVSEDDGWTHVPEECTRTTSLYHGVSAVKSRFARSLPTSTPVVRGEKGPCKARCFVVDPCLLLPEPLNLSHSPLKLILRLQKVTVVHLQC